MNTGVASVQLYCTRDILQELEAKQTVIQRSNVEMHDYKKNVTVSIFFSL